MTEATRTLNGRKLVGHASVDSGQLLIVDPCYIKRNEWSEEYEDGRTSTDGLTYASCCAATLSEGGAGEVDGLAVATSTGWGDGSYPVYAEYVGGRIMEITIEFEGQTERECVNCGDSIDSYEELCDSCRNEEVE